MRKLSVALCESLLKGKPYTQYVRSIQSPAGPLIRKQDGCVAFGFGCARISVVVIALTSGLCDPRHRLGLDSAVHDEVCMPESQHALCHCKAVLD